jgi:parvulin-like peptidyl-prolyl isomerase
VKAFFRLKYASLSLLVIVLASGCTSPKPTGVLTSQPTADLVTSQPAVIANVNGTEISTESFNRELARWNAGRAALGMGEAAADDKQHILDEMINDELTRELAAKQGLSIPDADVDAQINQSVQQYGQDYFNSWLSGNFYTMDEFRSFVRMELLTDKLKQPVVDAVPATASQVHARHILVNSQPDADQVLAKLQAGEDFAALAAQYSVDVTTKNNGGDLGWFPRGGLLVPQVEDAAFGLQPGQVSGVIQSDWGYHIVQTIEVGDREIDPQTRQRLIQQAITAWRQSLRTGANIQQFITFSP